MEKSSATSAASERPLSEGVANPHAPENATVDGNGTAVGEGVVEEVVEERVVVNEVSEAKSSKSGSELFLLGTFVLGLVGWVVATVSQAVVAATISRDPVRVLWFGFVIQTILTLLILLVILGSSTYNAAYAYGTQISIFAALATAFAVLGVDQNIYSPLAAQQATGAGWLILAIVDLSWIIFFTSPPQSPIFIVAETLVASRARNQEARQNKVEKIERSTDAFPLSPLHGGSTRGGIRGSRASGPPRLPDQQNPRVTGGDWALYTPPQKSGGRGTITSITSEPKTATASARVRSTAEESRVSGRAESAGVHPEDPLARTLSTGPPKPQWQAEALFPYTAAASDPNELSFKKGEILLIYDKSGKWWEAQTKNGKTGIAPSNYLRLLD